MNQRPLESRSDRKPTWTSFTKGPDGLEVYRKAKGDRLKKIVHIPGWGDTIYNHPMINGLADLDMDVSGIRLPRKAGGQRRETPVALEHKVNTLVPFLSGVDVLTGHSEGGAVATLALYHMYARRNEHTEAPQALPQTLILVTPAGSIGPESPMKLATRFIGRAAERFFTSPQSRRSFLQRFGESKGGLTNPQVIAQEVQGLAFTSIWPYLVFLQEQGVHIGIIAGKYDRVFPAEVLEKRAKEAGIRCKTAPIPHDGVHMQTQDVIAAIGEFLEEFSPSS